MMGFLSNRIQKRQWQSVHGSRIQEAWLLCQQVPRRTADARQPHLCLTQAPLQGNDGFEAWSTGSGEHVCHKIHVDSAESTLDVAHHQPSDGRRLVAEAAHDCGCRERYADHGLVKEVGLLG